jgi:hypothetical protein
MGAAEVHCWPPHSPHVACLKLQVTCQPPRSCRLTWPTSSVPPPANIFVSHLTNMTVSNSSLCVYRSVAQLICYLAATCRVCRPRQQQLCEALTAVFVAVTRGGRCTAVQGAETVVFAALDPGLKGRNVLFMHDKQPKQPSVSAPCLQCHPACMLGCLMCA